MAQGGHSVSSVVEPGCGQTLKEDSRMAAVRWDTQMILLSEQVESLEHHLRASSGLGVVQLV